MRQMKGWIKMKETSKKSRICMAVCWISFALLIFGGVLEYIHTKSVKNLPYTEICAVSAVICCMYGSKSRKEDEK